ncbi:MAG: winged helix-turn-helix domain-containing protein [Steroidobacterales bacterium]|jgi:molybdate transport system regulatory protein
MKRTAVTPPAAGVAAPAVRFRVEFGRAAAIGPGKIALLEHIEKSGSLSQSARELRMSYRRAWLLLRSLNTSFEEPAAVLMKGGRGGGGARLTAFGRALIHAYRDFDANLQARAAGTFKSIAAVARSRAPQKPRSTRRRAAAR